MEGMLHLQLKCRNTHSLQVIRELAPYIICQMAICLFAVKGFYKIVNIFFRTGTSGIVYKIQNIHGYLSLLFLFASLKFAKYLAHVESYGLYAYGIAGHCIYNYTCNYGNTQHNNFIHKTFAGKDF